MVPGTAVVAESPPTPLKAWLRTRYPSNRPAPFFDRRDRSATNSPAPVILGLVGRIVL